MDFGEVQFLMEMLRLCYWSPDMQWVLNLSTRGVHKGRLLFPWGKKVPNAPVNSIWNSVVWLVKICADQIHPGCKRNGWERQILVSWAWLTLQTSARNLEQSEKFSFLQYLESTTQLEIVHSLLKWKLWQWVQMSRLIVLPPIRDNKKFWSGTPASLQRTLNDVPKTIDLPHSNLDGTGWNKNSISYINGFLRG